MNQDIFLITANAMLKKSNTLADEAFKAYHSLLNPYTEYGESVWYLFLLHNSISDEIEKRIERYKQGTK